MTVSSIIIDYVGPSLRSSNAKPQFSAGHRATGDYGGVYLYGQANATLAIGDVVYFDKEFVANPLTTAASPRGAKVGATKVAMASGEWGFFQVGGQALVRTAGAVVANARINTTATAGAIDDDGTVGSKEILGAVLSAAAAGAGTTEATLTEPFINLTL